LYSYTQSVLGEALVGQKKYSDAEPLLLQGYRGLKEKENLIDGNRTRTLTEAAQRLVVLYTDWGKPDSAAQWRLAQPASTQQAASTQP
jgi:eukaryotic-like serine/threonine-protein kinase